MKKKVYEVPEIEVLEAKVEKGFSASGAPSQLQEMEMGDDATTLFN